MNHTLPRAGTCGLLKGQALVARLAAATNPTRETYPTVVPTSAR